MFMPSCNDTCDGCCTSAGQCITVAETGDTACGAKGAACENCTAHGAACVSGACFAQCQVIACPACSSVGALGGACCTQAGGGQASCGCSDGAGGCQ